MFGKFNKMKMQRFRQRQPLNDDEFFAKFYSNQGLSKRDVLALRQEIAAAIEIAATLLRPEDRFMVELADVKGRAPVDGGLAEMTVCAQRRIKATGRNVDISRLQTVDDYIRAFATSAS